jgi:beta-aspartyl-peptidase (threonine type)
MRLVLAKATIDQLAASRSMAVKCARPGGSAQKAAGWAIDHLDQKIGGLGGVILLDCQGNVGYAFNTPRMAYAYMFEGLDQPVFGINR